MASLEEGFKMTPSSVSKRYQKISNDIDKFIVKLEADMNAFGEGNYPSADWHESAKYRMSEPFVAVENILGELRLKRQDMDKQFATTLKLYSKK